MIEILRTASQSIKTPIMEVPFKADVSREQANKLRVELTPVPLSQVSIPVLLHSTFFFLLFLLSREPCFNFI